MAWRSKTPFLKRGGVFCFLSGMEGPMIKKAIATFLFILAILLPLLCPSFSFAEVKEIIAEGTYNMGDGETPTVAESRALLQAKRTAVEQAGTYVESYSKVKNFQLTVDEINVLSSGVMEVVVLDQKRSIVGNSLNFWVKIKARVTTDKMEEMSKRVKEKSVLEDYKRIQAAYDKSQKEIQALKKQLAAAKSAEGKNDIMTKIAEDERLFQTNEWFERGYAFGIAGKHQEAMEAFTRAIELDPKDAKAYYNRGLACHNLGDYGQAIRDYDRAIEVDPKYAMAYVNRSFSYMKIRNYQRAL